MSDDEQLEPTATEDDYDNSATEEEETVVTSSDSASSLASKEEERQKLQADIDAFLARGGKIHTVDKDVVSDPPKKPEANYGSQPI